MQKTLLYIDASYSLDQIRERDLQHVLEIRKLEGYWDKVYSVHPIDDYGQSGDRPRAYGDPVYETVGEDHIFLRGHFGLTERLAKLSPLNFLLGQFALVRHLVRLVRQENITAIRAGDSLLCGLIGKFVSQRTGRPLMVRVNGNNDALREATGRPIMPRLFRSIRIECACERHVLSYAHSVIVPSEDYRQFALSKGARPERCTQVRYGNLIDPRHLMPAAEREPLDDPYLNERPFLFYIGRLENLKFAGDCIEVLRMQAEAGRDIALVMAGDGSQREALELRVKELGIEDRVHFIGNQAQRELARIIPMAAGVLSPITGRSLTEVAFGEAPILAYDIDWQAELIVDGVSGFLVPARDMQAMSDAVSRILDDPDLARHLGTGARQRAFEMLEPARQTELEIEAYEAMLSSDPPAL